MPIKSDKLNAIVIPATETRTPDQYYIRQLTINWSTPSEPINAFVVLTPYISSTGEPFPDHSVSFTLENIMELSQTDLQLAEVFDKIVSLTNRVATERGII